MHEEEWKESNSFGRDDLPKVNVVTEKAYEWILAQKNTSKSATKKASKRTPKN